MVAKFFEKNRWNSLLSTSIEVSKRLRYIFTTHNLERTQKSGEWKNIQVFRKMTNIKILQLLDQTSFCYRYNAFHDSSILNSAITRLLSDNNEWLDTLHIDAIDNEFNLVQVLTAANRVRELKIGGKFQKFHFHSNLPKVKHLAYLNRLKSLELHVSCNNIFYYFSRSQIENLLINARIPIKFKKLKSFLNTQRSLKRFTVECDTLNDFFQEPLSSDEKDPFQLKHLAIKTTCVMRGASSRARQNFIDFLAVHCMQVESLNLKFFPYPEILLFISSNLRLLKKLTIHDGFTLKHGPVPRFYGSLLNVKRLELTSAFMYDKEVHELYIENLLKTFPNVEYFSIIKINGNILELIANSFGSKLKELKLLYFPKIPNNSKITFPKLKVLKVQYIKAEDVMNFMINFFQHNPSIEDFHAEPLNFRFEIWRNVIEKLKSSTNLKKVIIRDIEY